MGVGLNMKYDDNMQIPDFLVVLYLIKTNKNCSCTLINMEYGLTYSHTNKLVNRLVEKEWLLSNKNNHPHLLTLTDKGYLICNSIETLFSELGIDDDYIRNNLKLSKFSKIQEVI
jgi:predicted transcriptional regulator